MISRSVSSRLTVLRFPLIVLVVLFHSYTTSVDLAGGGIAGSQQVNPISAFVRIFISKGFGNLAVPLFFLVSGFLFFQKYDGSRAVYKEKLSRRVKTLLVPFLIWNFATYLVYFIGESIPATKVYFATKYWPPIRSFSALDYANAFFGFTVKFPMSYQFWFIRDLMVMVVFAPLIYLLLKRRAVALPFLAILFYLWMTGTGRWWFPDPRRCCSSLQGASSHRAMRTFSRSIAGPSHSACALVV